MSLAGVDVYADGNEEDGDETKIDVECTSIDVPLVCILPNSTTLLLPGI